MKLLRIALPMIAVAIFCYWMAWPSTLGTAYMGRDLTAGEAFKACFINQWPEVKNER